LLDPIQIGFLLHGTLRLRPLHGVSLFGTIIPYIFGFVKGFFEIFFRFDRFFAFR
jgi:hypothetical protein